MCRSHQKETIAENTAFLQVKWQDGMVETRFRLLGDHGQVLLIRNELGRMKNDLWEACLPGKRITGMRYHLIPVIFFLTSAPNHAGAAFESRHHRAGHGDGGGGRCRPTACFCSGANAAISGDMLTTSGITIETDMQMLRELGYTPRKWER